MIKFPHIIHEQSNLSLVENTKLVLYNTFYQIIQSHLKNMSILLKEWQNYQYDTLEMITEFLKTSLKLFKERQILEANVNYSFLNLFCQFFNKTKT